MPDIGVTLRNDSGASKAPPTIFNGVLDADQVTDLIMVFAADGLNGKIAYQRSDSPVQLVDVVNGDEVRMM